MLPPSIPPSSSSNTRIAPSISTSADKRDDPFGEFTKPTKMKRGIFTGRWMRFALSIEQQPVLGRRKSDKDRRSRPIVPCPILRFRAIECRLHHHHHHHHHHRQPHSHPQSQNTHGKGGSVPDEEWVENEVDPIAIEPTLLICAARLEPSRTQTHPSSKSHSTLPSTSAVEALKLPQSTPASSWSGASVSNVNQALSHEHDDTISVGIAGPGPSSTAHRSMANRMTVDYLSNPTSSRSAPTSTLTSMSDEGQAHSHSRPYENNNGYHASLSALNGSSGTTDGGAPSLSAGKRPRPEEEEKDEDIGQSRNLYGGLHVSAVRVPCIEGGTGTWFLFTDLAVRREGTYTLRFQCYDITAVDANFNSDGSQPSQALVECQSQSFTVYLPRHVPPTPRPTALAEHFIQQGFKLNIRKNERMAASPSPPG